MRVKTNLQLEGKLFISNSFTLISISRNSIRISWTRNSSTETHLPESLLPENHLLESHLRETHLPKSYSHKSHLTKSQIPNCKLTKCKQPQSNLISISNYDAKISLNYSGSKSLPLWVLDSFFVGFNPTGST